MQNLDTSILDEQVIAVPKIVLDRIPQRSALRRTQKPEELVEVPTEPGYSQRTWSRSLIFQLVAVFKVSPQARDQVVDIPVVAQMQIPLV